MEAKYTKGPWYINKAAAAKGIARVTSDYGTIAECAGWKDSHFANARLIAAAPDLLKACQFAIQLTACDMDNAPCTKEFVKEQLRAALSKAGQPLG